MRTLARRSAILAIGFALASFAPTGFFSPAALAMLDPSQRATSSCGSGAAGGALRHELLLAAAVAGPLSKASDPMPLYEDLAGPRLHVTTSSEKARRYFNQGLLLTYGFNHAGAVRSFRASQRLDPTCALCWWGEAVALGPNINAAMEDRDRESALAAMDQANRFKYLASPIEQSLIDAGSRRYSRDPKADRAALDVAYADAMLDSAKRFPQDDDVAVLAAEAVMDVSPWNYWQADRRTPVGRSGEAVNLVEAVLARNPNNLQAASSMP
jgi:hypothetical protein